jgi:hypothetical protein
LVSDQQDDGAGEEPEGEGPPETAETPEAAAPPEPTEQSEPETPPATTEQPMDIHKPKPIHSWRELATEFGVIVLGILTALGLEQAVESYHERERLEESTRAIEAQLRQGLAVAEVMGEIYDCQRQQLAVLSDAVGERDQTRVKSLLDQSRIYQNFPFNSSAWTTALASDVSNQFDERQREFYPGPFLVLEREAQWTSDYWRSFTRLTAYAQSGLAKSSAAADGAVREVAEMSSVIENMQGALGDYRRTVEQQLEIKASQDDVDALPIDHSFVAQCEAAAKAMARGG